MIRSRVLCRIVALFLFVAGPAASALAGTFSLPDRRAAAPVRRQVEAAHFLSLATFGPTLEEIDALAARMATLGRTEALVEWIDSQFALPVTNHHALAMQMIAEDGFDVLDPSINHNRYKHHAWWQAALTAPDQLRQRMAWALAQIFVVNENGAGFGNQRIDGAGEPQYLGIVDYYDMLVENAFGNYRECLGDVTLHPIMGMFLSHLNNPKGDLSIGRFPDENFSRESMQLLSVGLYDLQQNGVLKTTASGEPIETYDSVDISEAARVFTGLSFAGARAFGDGRTNFHQPMEMFEDAHDTEAKFLLDGVQLPAQQTGMDDINSALDNLYFHPNTAPFLARLLIQRFVRSNPSKTYIRAVANAFDNNGSGVRGDLRAVLKTMLLHREARAGMEYRRLRRPWRLQVSGAGTEYSRLREPVLRYTGFLRAFHPSSVLTHTLGDVITEFPGRYRIPAMDSTFHQQAYRAPHVFNFYLPDHRPAGAIRTYVPSRSIPNGELFAPEFEILTPVAANRIGDRFNSDVKDAVANFRANNDEVTGRFDMALNLDMSMEEGLAEQPEALMEHLDLLLCHGTMSDEAKATIATIVAEETDNLQTRSRAAILAVLTSPDAAVTY